MADVTGTFAAASVEKLALEAQGYNEAGTKGCKYYTSGWPSEVLDLQR